MDTGPRHSTPDTGVVARSPKNDDLAFATIADVSAQLQARTLSPVELTRAMLDRIAAVDGPLKSYQHVMADSAMAEARSAEAEIGRGEIKGPLHGVPLAVKDLCWTTDAPTLAGMAINRGFEAPEDGTVVRRLREAGAVILGKLAMTEGAYAGYHPDMPVPVNPWDAGIWPGASSSGSGVATAAGLCYGSIGSDTGGSIRFPSAANGITGLKPTWGRVSRHGSFDLGPTLDHLGPMTRSAADAAAMLQAIAGVDPKDATTLRAPVPDFASGLHAGIRGLKVGLAPAFVALGADADTLRVLDETAATLRSLGAELIEIDFPDAAEMLADWFPQCAVETAVVHEATYPSRKSDYGEGLAGFIDLAAGVTATDMQKMALRRHAFRGRVSALFDRVDVLLLPVQGIAAPSMTLFATLALDERLMNNLLRFSCIFDLSGHPVLTVPAGFTAATQPIGMQLIGPHLDEATVLRAGHAFQQASAWHKRHPALEAAA